MRADKEAILTPTAAALWAAVFLGYAHQGLLQPLLPLYLKHLGHSASLIGLVLAAFSVTSFSLRPVIGYFTDEWSVVRVLALGVLVMAVGGAGLLVPLLAVIVVANAVRGIGWAALNTAGSTLLAHIAPSSRRAQAAGYYTMFQNAATAVSSPVALWLVGLSLSSFNTVFLIAVAAGLLAAIIARTIAEPPGFRKSRRQPTLSRLRTLATMLDRDVALPMFLQTCLILSYPALTAFVVLYGPQVGLSDASIIWYFLANGVTAVVIRIALGRVQDRIGRGLSMALGFAIVTASIAILATAAGETQLVASGICYAIGYSLASAGLTALAIDMANPMRRGAAMATYSMANQLGSGIGSALSGALIDAAGFRTMYALAVVPGLVGLAAIWLARRRIAAV